MDNLKKSQTTIIAFLIIIILIIAVFAWLIVADVINKNDNVVLKTSNLLIDIQPNINRKLDVNNDLKINKIKSNAIKITNNGSNTNYKIVMNNVVDDDNDIKVAINNNMIRDLSKVKKESNSYIIYEGKIASGYTDILNIRLWLTNDKNKNIKYNFVLSVIEI